MSVKQTKSMKISVFFLLISVILVVFLSASSAASTIQFNNNQPIVKEKLVISSSLKTIQVSSPKLSQNGSSVQSKTADQTSPKIVDTDPLNNGVNVPNNKVIKIIFNEPIKEGINYNKITLKNSNKGCYIFIKKNINGKVLSIALDSGIYRGGYTFSLNLPVNCVADLYGNGIVTTNKYTFTVSNSLNLNILKNDLESNGVYKSFNLWKDYRKELQFFNNNNISITKRSIDNGDIILYFDIKNPVLQKVNLDIGKILRIYKYDKYYEKPPTTLKYGFNKVTGPFAYLDLEKGSIIISKLYYYKELYEKYPNNEYSHILELDEEKSDIKLQTTSLTANISPLSSVCSFFILFSQDKLFKNTSNADKYFKDYFSGIKYNDVINSYFVRYDGTYTKVTNIILPYSKDGYGFSLHQSSKYELLDYYIPTKERYFYDLIVNGIMQTFFYQKNVNGVFYTPYTSNLLKQEANITAPFVDTRLNRSFGLLLDNFQTIFPNFKLPYIKKNFADYLINQIKLNNVYNYNSGIAFPDYFKDNIKLKTHASLNHNLSLIHLMFDVYEKTHNNQYLDLAKKMIRFIELTKTQWIKPNNDLYYAVELKDNKYYMFSKDYVYVTFIDLLTLQRYLILNNLGKNAVIDDLIRSKLKYLEAAGYSIFDDNATIAGNGESTKRPTALALYKSYLNFFGKPYPKIISTDPANNERDVPNNKKIKITFQGPIKEGYAFNKIILKNNVNGYTIAINKVITDNTLIISLNRGVYRSGHEYKIILPINCVLDSNNNGFIAEYSSNFTIL